ncbi:MAG: phosphoribosylformylglycinamidine cyclo-ligase [Dehalococcoidia bacterium]|nr:phosphoribosylformylglycinamidine cyclo-ligase [Dehalococcoidia bacterium]
MTSAYGRAGVRTTEELGGFPRMLDALRETFALRAGRDGAPLLDFGLYANVLDLGNNTGLAISTDGVGTKLIVAGQLGKFDTVGIDCVAMNANDIVCVGAEPVAMTDYIAIDRDDPEVLAQVAVGLRRGAELAGISIPGGEIAQVREMVNGVDLVGTCVGLVPVDRIVTGARIARGDAIVGFASSGIHSNGLTLAREVLVGERTTRLAQHVAELGRTLGEELLEPTTIYVGLALRLLRELDVHALAHITGDGFLNLARFSPLVGFRIESLPEAPAIFRLIEREGQLDAAELYLVYNMGVGFCAVLPEADVERALRIGRDCGIAGWRIGTCTDDADRTVTVAPAGLRSEGGHFVRA